MWGRQDPARRWLLPQEAVSTGDAPPIVVGTSFGSFAPARRARSRSLRYASSPHRAGRSGDPRLETSKRERAAPGGREKALRRVGLRKRRPPAAGGGRLALLRGSQGRKRVTLGETFGPGKSGIHPAPLFAAAGCLVRELVKRTDVGIGPYGDAEDFWPCVVQATTTARAARSNCAAVGGSAAYRCSVPFAGKRNARKEEPVEHW